MELNDDSWHLVKDTPRVMGFIGGTKEKPSPLSNIEAQGIMQQLEQGSILLNLKFRLNREKWLEWLMGHSMTSVE